MLKWIMKWNRFGWWNKLKIEQLASVLNWKLNKHFKWIFKATVKAECLWINLAKGEMGL